MTEMIFDTCHRLGGYVRWNVVQDLIVERWQIIFSDSSTLRYHNLFGPLCTFYFIDHLGVCVSKHVKYRALLEILQTFTVFVLFYFTPIYAIHIQTQRKFLNLSRPSILAIKQIYLHILFKP
jgi:hypothetical protein